MAEFVDKKIEKIEKTCYELAKKEQKDLKDNNDNNSNEKIALMIEEYKENLSKKYVDELSKINRENKRELFDFEKEEKMKVKQLKIDLTNNLLLKITNEFESYTNTDEYKQYLLNNIQNTLRKFKSANDCIIYITQKDYDKFSLEIQNTYNLKIEKMENENIGGCIIVNNVEKISIDNTLKTNIQEEIYKVNL